MRCLGGWCDGEWRRGVKWRGVFTVWTIAIVAGESTFRRCHRRLYSFKEADWITSKTWPVESKVVLPLEVVLPPSVIVPDEEPFEVVFDDPVSGVPLLAIVPLAKEVGSVEIKVNVPLASSCLRFRLLWCRRC